MCSMLVKGAAQFSTPLFSQMLITVISTVWYMYIVVIVLGVIVRVFRSCSNSMVVESTII